MNTIADCAPSQDELAVGASGAEVRRASAWLIVACAQRDVPLAQAQRLEICLNEVLDNVLSYGGSAVGNSPIRLQLTVLPAPDVAQVAEARVTVTDAGVAFNPLVVAMPPHAHSVAEARPGGLGLVMIRRCSDLLDYRREGGENHFTFGARWGGGPTTQRMKAEG